MFNKRKGQSTVEYIVLVTAVIGVTIAFLLSPASPFRQTLTGSMEQMTDQIENMSDRLAESTPTTNATTPAGTSGVTSPVIDGACATGTYNAATNECE